MKKTLFRSMLFAALAVGASVSASAQIYVNVRPVAPVVVQTARPGPTHVWIGEEWHEDGHGYRYAGGHWEAPPHDGDRWNQGHWDHDRDHGHHWVAGGWHGRK